MRNCHQQGITETAISPPIDVIRRKKWIKLLGVKFQDDSCCWEMHVDELLSKASERMYILRVCESYCYASDQLTKLFETLILSLLSQKNGYFNKISGWICYFIEHLWKEGVVRCLKLQTGPINIISSCAKTKKTYMTDCGSSQEKE